jgi:diguanylate cyclase (GGDEF)-like protein
MPQSLSGRQTEADADNLEARSVRRLGSTATLVAQGDLASVDCPVEAGCHIEAKAGAGAAELAETSASAWRPGSELPKPDGMDESASWLCPDQVHRERMVDMETRLKPMRARAFGILGIGLLLMGPWLGYSTTIVALIAAAAGAALFTIAEKRAASTTRPEYWIFASWLVSLAIIATVAAAAGGVNGPAMAWFAVPVSTLSARFPLRVVVTGVTTALGVMVAVAFGTDASATIEHPSLLIGPAVLVAAVAMLSLAGMRSDIHHRASAFVDPLTGCLNRAALENRLQELTQQSAVTRQPVGLIIGDIDHFKLINDMQGHAAGDAVLVDVAYALRKEMRAYDSVYRIGGEEFLVVLPGSNLAKAAALANVLRIAIEGTGKGPGLSVTMSFGVSASIEGEVFEYKGVHEEGDRALYEAKRSGRNRVCLAGKGAARAA